MTLAIVYSILLITSVAVIWMSNTKLIGRASLIAALIVTSVVMYLFASQSGISPFSRDAIGFGFWDNTVELSIGVLATLSGVFASIAMTSSEEGLTQRIWRPLIVSPLILLPTLELVEDSGDRTLVSLMLLFSVAFQNGFFWQKVLENDD